MKQIQLRFPFLAISIVSVFANFSAMGQGDKAWYKPAAMPESYKLSRDGCVTPSREAFEACMNKAGWTLIERNKIDASRKECREKYPPISNNLKNTDAYFECMREKGWEDESVANRELRKLNIKSEEELCQKSEFSDAIKNLPCRVRDITIEHLSNTSKVTNESRQFYIDFFKLFDDGKVKYNQIMRNGSMMHKKIYEYRISVSEPKSDENKVALITGQISFGEYNKRRKELDAEYQKTAMKINDEVKDFISGSPSKRQAY